MRCPAVAWNVIVAFCPPAVVVIVFPGSSTTYAASTSSGTVHAFTWRVPVAAATGSSTSLAPASSFFGSTKLAPLPLASVDPVALTTVQARSGPETDIATRGPVGRAASAVWPGAVTVTGVAGPSSTTGPATARAGTLVTASV